VVERKQPSCAGEGGSGWEKKKKKKQEAGNIKLFCGFGDDTMALNGASAACMCLLIKPQ
jgi:hypothetical protein